MTNLNPDERRILADYIRTKAAYEADRLTGLFKMYGYPLITQDSVVRAEQKLIAAGIGHHSGLISQNVFWDGFDSDGSPVTVFAVKDEYGDEELVFIRPENADDLLDALGGVDEAIDLRNWDPDAPLSSNIGALSEQPIEYFYRSQEHTLQLRGIGSTAMAHEIVFIFMM